VTVNKKNKYLITWHSVFLSGRCWSVSSLNFPSLWNPKFHHCHQKKPNVSPVWS